MPILKALVSHPESSLSRQPIPAPRLSADVSCRVRWVQNHRPGFLELPLHVRTNHRMCKVVILCPVDAKLPVVGDQCQDGVEPLSCDEVRLPSCALPRVDGQELQGVLRRQGLPKLLLTLRGEKQPEKGVWPALWPKAASRSLLQMVPRPQVGPTRLCVVCSCFRAPRTERSRRDRDRVTDPQRL